MHRMFLSSFPVLQDNSVLTIMGYFLIQYVPTERKFENHLPTIKTQLEANN